MSDRRTSHHTVVVRRRYDAPVARVFRAWEDPAALQAWYTPGDASWTSEILEHDFRVGGVKRLKFGPPGQTPFFESCRYEDIVAEGRLCYAMTISHGDVRITTSMVTVEFLPHGERTELIVTDQLVVLDGGETAADRERGWGETLDKLTPYLRSRRQPG
jgi:uncharacterized protein YndB with AHSA1/START domain